MTRRFGIFEMVVQIDRKTTSTKILIDLELQLSYLEEGTNTFRPTDLRDNSRGIRFFDTVAPEMIG